MTRALHLKNGLSLTQSKLSKDPLWFSLCSYRQTRITRVERELDITLVYLMYLRSAYRSVLSAMNM
jgi:hypothetical protein